jgi:hypothetical protein
VLFAGHLKFIGDLSVAPIVGGSAGAVQKVLSGTLEVSVASNFVVSFGGGVTLPGRPAASLSLTITESPFGSGNATLEGRYAQDGVTVSMTGSATASGSTLTLADSSGVATTLASTGTVANVTVSGRQTAVIDLSSNRITYIDGTFESLD